MGSSSYCGSCLSQSFLTGNRQDYFPLSCDELVHNIRRDRRLVDLQPFTRLATSILGWLLLCSRALSLAGWATLWVPLVAEASSFLDRSSFLVWAAAARSSTPATPSSLEELASYSAPRCGARSACQARTRRRRWGPSCRCAWRPPPTKGAATLCMLVCLSGSYS